MVEYETRHTREKKREMIEVLLEKLMVEDQWERYGRQLAEQEEEEKEKDDVSPYIP